MRAMLVTAMLLAACDRSAPRAESDPSGVTSVSPESTGGETGDPVLPRLDLPAEAPATTGEAPALTTGEGATTGLLDSTGEEMPDATTTGGETSGESTESTGGSTGESTGAAESSSGGEDSTGEPVEPSICGDGVCAPAERDPCYTGPGWCFGDCWKAPECKSDCPCTPAAAAIKNFCTADPPPDCPATAPGGYCDPDGDGLQADADTVRGFYEWAASCGP